VTPAATLRILARDFESDAFVRDGNDIASPLKLEFSDFSVESLTQDRSRRLRYARKFFPGAMYGDCVIERPYKTIPPMARDFTLHGAIVLAPEELLLQLRLFRPGDLAFVGVNIERPAERGPCFSTLHPYRVISGIGGDSTRQFRLDMAELSKWETFAQTLSGSPSWTSAWFQVARRSFLKGSGDEFNANFPSEVDRVADYVAALEAALVPETDFVSRRLRERATSLLALGGDTAGESRKLLSDIYAIRSTLVHGSPLSQEQMALLQDRARGWSFEELVRQLLVTAVMRIPLNEARRREYLSALYDVDDQVRGERISEEFRAVKHSTMRKELLAKLQRDA
jgi:hypothetical protein